MGQVISFTDKRINASLLEACEKGLADDVSKLLDEGAEVNTRNQDGWTPLIAASFFGHQKIVRFLLDRGANLFLKDNEGWTASKWADYIGYESINQILEERAVAESIELGKELLLVAAAGDTEEAARLIDRGADVNIRVEETGLHFDDTPLIVAAREGNTDIVRMLLENNAEVDVVDQLSWTPLHRACAEGYLEIIRLLLVHGANPDREDPESGYTAWDLASCETYLEMKKFLSKLTPEK